ncbi:MAG: PBP1A family penicillin-binding protein [Coriobacteriia bacterium]|nr:PBP1A family penicillin-binding protein [Coriobacteriia bacterium]MBN2822072.1 PBP1A family penicillin-binding protein [Coriobacteriia bacterium]
MDDFNSNPRRNRSSAGNRSSASNRKNPAPRQRQRTNAQPTPRKRAPRAGAGSSGQATQRPVRKTPNRQAGAVKRRPSGQKSPARKPARKPRSVWRKVLRIAAIATGLGIVGGLIAVGVVYASVSKDLPDLQNPTKGRDQTSVIYDRNGDVLTELYAEQNRTDVAFEQIPVQLRQAVISTEDQRYYEHKGVDPLGIARALWVDITQNKRHGGSTITQQYVVNTFVEREGTITRKIKEAILAYKLEKEYTKDEILTMYLNTIYFGHGAYGVQSAAETYFGKDVSELSLAECAMIGGVIKSPGNYSPRIDPDAAKDRRDTVLGQMLSEGYIEQAEHDAAVAEEFALAQVDVDTTTPAPYFVEWIKQTLIDEYGPDQVFKGGLHITTTIDLTMQQAAEDAIAAELDQEDDPSASLVAVEPSTGEVLAMVGGKDFATQQYNVAVQGHRQPGSAFKPFVLVAGLENGVLPEQTYESSAARLDIPGGQVWKVTGTSAGGLMRLRQATEKSVNSVFAQLILEVGADTVVETAQRLGITTDVEAVPAIALGGLKNGVTPLEMASAYATLANAGTYIPPYGILEVKDSDGEVLHTADAEGVEAISPAVAYLTTDILKGVISKGTGTAAQIGRPAAGKTGTTQQYRDAWFCGYTPQIAASVWVGHVEGQIEMTNVHGRKVTGGSFPAEIWARFMKAALDGQPKEDFERPKGLTSATICLESGQIPTEYCEKTGSALFLSGHLPGECEIHTGPTEIELPNFIGMTKEAAITLLNKLLLAFKVEEQEMYGVSAGIVGDQDPRYPSTVTTETVVTLYVSKGAPVNEPPVATFTYTPKTPSANEEITFDASESEADGGIAKYAWEFGDSSPLVEGAIVKHKFTTAGKYTVTLWVTDEDGLVSSLPIVVEVK